MNLKKAMLKKMGNQNEQLRPPAVDGIKIFDNVDQAANIIVACQLLKVIVASNSMAWSSLSKF